VAARTELLGLNRKSKRTPICRCRHQARCASRSQRSWIWVRVSIANPSAHAASVAKLRVQIASPSARRRQAPRASRSQIQARCASRSWLPGRDARCAEKQKVGNDFEKKKPAHLFFLGAQAPRLAPIQIARACTKSAARWVGGRRTLEASALGFKRSPPTPSALRASIAALLDFTAVAQHLGFPRAVADQELACAALDEAPASAASSAAHASS